MVIEHLSLPFFTRLLILSLFLPNFLSLWFLLKTCETHTCEVQCRASRVARREEASHKVRRKVEGRKKSSNSAHLHSVFTKRMIVRGKKWECERERGHFAILPPSESSDGFYQHFIESSLREKSDRDWYTFLFAMKCHRSCWVWLTWRGKNIERHFWI